MFARPDLAANPHLIKLEIEKWKTEIYFDFPDFSLLLFLSACKLVRILALNLLISTFPISIFDFSSFPVAP